MTDLSILIPARSEMFLYNTVQDALKNIEGNTEIIVVLDGEWSDPPLPIHERVTVIYNPVSVGQRAATNQAARISEGKYVMKVDAHCSFDKGFDVKMVEGFKEIGDDATMVPLMYRLHAFDWKCLDCGFRMYQNPTPERCEQCGSKNLKRKLVWQPRTSPQNTSFRFDKTLHFQYFPEYKKRQEYLDAIPYTESMSLQGSCFMLTREKYFELNICDEQAGSWGQQGTEVACKTWLSGGRVVVNHNTWYAHMFRTNDTFTFPYPLPGSEVARARAYINDLFLNNKWDKAVHDLQWLVDKFAPVPDWS